jgi:NAD(P)-dependent dehydrogenase (short-subunit alcohol dehydrogenase family)
MMQTGGSLLQGKVALVTGAASGIGRAASLAFAAQGASVCLVDRDQERLFATRQELRETGTDALALSADVRDSSALKQAIDQGGAWKGGLDIVFSNAGVVGLLTPIEHMPEEEWERILDINLTGSFRTLKHAIPWMKAKGGSIIMNSSIHGSRVFNSYGMTAYSASKSGLNALAKMAAAELSAYKIRVNLIYPGAIESHLNDSLVRDEALAGVGVKVEYPEGKYPYGKGTSEQVAKLAVFLASDLSDYINGAEITIDGVRSLI